MHDFDRDTALASIGDKAWRAELGEGWCVGPVPNGGYLMAIVLKAMGQHLPHPDPFTATIHYLRPAQIGAAEIEVDVVRIGRGHSTARATLSQEGKARLTALATFGDLSAPDGPDFMPARPPDEAPPPEGCLPLKATGLWVPEVARRFDWRYPPECLRWFQGQEQEARLGAWIRFEDGRPNDLLSLAMFCDAFPPPVRTVMEIGWVPTIELTVHFKGKPAPGWVLGWFKTRWCQGGYLEEDGELWDSQGRLVAISRQMARVHARTGHGEL